MNAKPIPEYEDLDMDRYPMCKSRGVCLQNNFEVKTIMRDPEKLSKDRMLIDCLISRLVWSTVNIRSSSAIHHAEWP